MEGSMYGTIGRNFVGREPLAVGVAVEVVLWTVGLLFSHKDTVRCGSYAAHARFLRKT